MLPLSNSMPIPYGHLLWQVNIKTHFVDWYLTKQIKIDIIHHIFFERRKEQGRDNENCT